MSSQKQKQLLQDSNTTEPCNENQNVLNYYISQRVDILSKMNSEKQNDRTKEYLEDQKTLLEEKSITCQEFEKANESMKDNLKKELKERNDLVNVLKSSDELLKNNVESSNRLQNLLQLCINGLQDANALKHEVLLNFEEKKRNNIIKEEKYVEKINYLKEYLQNCKQEHLLKVEYLDKNIETISETIDGKKPQIFHLSDQITNLSKCNQKLMEDLNNLEKENYNMTKENLELQKTCEEFMKQKKTEETEYKKSMFDLQLNSTNLSEKYLNLEKEFHELQKGLDCKTEFLKSLQNENKSSELKLSNLKTTFDETEKEIKKIEAQLQNDVNDDKINSLKKQILETEEKNKCLEEDVKILEQGYFALKNEHNDIINQIDIIKNDLMKYDAEMKQKEVIFNEQNQKFKFEIVVLEKSFDEEIQTEINLQKRKEELETKVKDFDKQFEEITLKQNEASAEAEEKEITINIKIDSIKDQILKEKSEICELEKNISHIKADGQDRQENMKQQYELKIEKLNLEVKNMKRNLNDLYKNDQKEKSDALKKLNDTCVTLQLQTSELKASTQSLEKEINLKIKELQQLQQQLNDINKTENLNTDSEENSNLKRSRYDFKIPEYKIPPAKYSSTSDSSMEERPLLKRRKVTFKHRTQEKNLSALGQQGSEKNINDTFTAFKSGTGTKAAPPRKKSIKKAVF